MAKRVIDILREEVNLFKNTDWEESKKLGEKEQGIFLMNGGVSILMWGKTLIYHLKLY